MATDFNRVILIGRATKDVELKATQGGTQVASMSIANNRSWTQNGEKKEQVSFFNCTAWGKLAETLSKYVHKGDKIAVEGRLQQRTWEKDGQKHSVVEVVIDNVQFLGSPSGSQKSDSMMGGEVTDGSVASFDQQAPSHFSDESIPF